MNWRRRRLRDKKAAKVREELRQQVQAKAIACKLTGLRPLPSACVHTLMPIDQYLQGIQYGSIDRLKRTRFYATDFGYSNKVLEFGLPELDTSFTHVIWFT